MREKDTRGKRDREGNSERETKTTIPNEEERGSIERERQRDERAYWKREETSN